MFRAPTAASSGPPPSLQASSPAPAASSAASAPFDEIAGLREFHRLQDRALPWIKQLSAAWAVPHPAVVDFNLASDRYMRAVDSPGMHGGLAALQEACAHLERVAAPATNVAAMPPGAMPADRFSAGTDTPRLVRTRLETSQLMRRLGQCGPSARRLLSTRKQFLGRLDMFAARGLQGGSPSSADRLVSQNALQRIEQILAASRQLRGCPEAQLAPLAREQARLVAKQRQLRESGIVDAHALNSSEARGRRLLAVYTAATPRDLARALASYEAFLDGLPRRHAAEATSHPAPPLPPPAPHDDGDLHDPFGVFAGL